MPVLDTWIRKKIHNLVEKEVYFRNWMKIHIEEFVDTLYAPDSKETDDYVQYAKRLFEKWAKTNLKDWFHFSSEEFLSIIYQTQEQKNLMALYGQELLVMDSTYKTTKYDLSLFFLVVKTNVSYLVRSYFYQ